MGRYIDIDVLIKSINEKEDEQLESEKVGISFYEKHLGVIEEDEDEDLDKNVNNKYGKKHYEPRQCKNKDCRKVFNPTTATHRFCTHNCRTKASPSYKNRTRKKG